MTAGRLLLLLGLVGALDSRDALARKECFYEPAINGYACSIELPNEPSEPRVREPEAPRETEAQRRQREKEEADYAARAQVFRKQILLVRDQLRDVVHTAAAAVPQRGRRLAPEGSQFFAPRPPEEDDADTFASPIGSQLTPGSRIPLENLRRAAVILKTVAGVQANPALQPADAAYLAGQAALAMEGAPLSIRVPDSPPLPPALEAGLREAVGNEQSLRQARDAAGRAAAARARIEREIFAVDDRVRGGGPDVPALKAKREKLLADFQVAAQAQEEAAAKMRVAEQGAIASRAKVKARLAGAPIVVDNPGAPAPAGPGEDGAR